MFRRSIRIVLASLALTAVAVPTVAFADAAPVGKQVREKGEKGDKGQFPMAADKFKERVEARITKGRAKLVERLDKKGVDAEKKTAALAKFDEAAKEVRAAVDTACADSTVTADEAKSVRQVAKKLHGDHKKAKADKAKKGKKGKKGSKDA